MKNESPFYYAVSNQGLRDQIIGLEHAIIESEWKRNQSDVANQETFHLLKRSEEV